ncbi:MAG: tRNA pseudouridine(38-40) synthase TruA [Parasporobacterium sp.]|nr:tRNA pseudouridine(38-40) synthase TruA [Parasporobacterium sp.]
MKRIRLTIAYDGTAYVGWQIQKNGLAVEQVINEHLSALLKEDIAVIGASRTDSGVHARGNVAVFDTETRIPAGKIALTLNQSLPDDIKIVSSEEVPEDFHPRYADCIKTYQYSITNCRYQVPTQRLYSDYVYYPLDVEKMRQAAGYLIGEHDFIAFSSSGGQQKTSVRTIYSIDITREPVYPSEIWENAPLTGDPEESKLYDPSMIRITVKGNGFLYNMVRIIAGTLEKAGMGVFPPEHVREILESRDRRLSSPKASAAGLCLMNIRYL